MCAILTNGGLHAVAVGMESSTGGNFLGEKDKLWQIYKQQSAAAQRCHQEQNNFDSTNVKTQLFTAVKDTPELRLVLSTF